MLKLIVNTFVKSEIVKAINSKNHHKAGIQGKVSDKKFMMVFNLQE